MNTTQMNQSQISGTGTSNQWNGLRATNNLGPVPNHRLCENSLILNFVLQQKTDFSMIFYLAYFCEYIIYF